MSVQQNTGEVQHSSAINNNEAQLLVYLKSFLLINMAELDHQRSAAKTLVNKIGLDTREFAFILMNTESVFLRVG